LFNNKKIFGNPWEKLKRGENNMRNYPKTRKAKSNTDYAISTQLLKTVGVDKFKEIFSRVGMYLAAKELSNELSLPVSPYICQYIRRYKLNTGDNNEESNI
jgi:hypothetical protein